MAVVIALLEEKGTNLILKAKDSSVEVVSELNRLLSLPLNSRQRSLVEQELRTLQAGARNEDNAAYFLNFHLKDSKNWAVIHDLRIEHRGKVAQIDHIVINRLLYVYVLESKSFAYGVEITGDGEFLRLDGKTSQGMESPIEQNNRHIFALEQSISDRNLAPTRLGFPIPISCRNVVLVSPKSKIIRSSNVTDTASVIKADAFFTHSQKEFEKSSVIEMGKLIASETLREFAERLVRLHRPSPGIDYKAKFGIKENMVASPPPPAYAATDPVPAPTSGAARTCDKCGVAVETKVVNFCRFNKVKFGGHTLCRVCQTKA